MIGKPTIAQSVFLAGVMYLCACSPPGPEDFPLGKIDYSVGDWPRCPTSALPGESGRSNHEKLSGGYKFSVRTPANYDSAYQHPLIVVYSPAQHHRFRTEAFMDLTTLATGAGFIIAYVDSFRLSVQKIELLSQVPGAVSSKWCVDQSRIYLTGHSDGATVANAIAFLPNMPFHPKAIVPSAAGIRAQDMRERSCPQPLSVMTWQNSADALFPDYGRQLAIWWAQCSSCALETRTLTPQCESFTNCEKDVEIALCISDGKHRDWPNANKDLIEFFSRH